MSASSWCWVKQWRWSKDSFVLCLLANIPLPWGEDHHDQLRDTQSPFFSHYPKNTYFCFVLFFTLQKWHHITTVSTMPFITTTAWSFLICTEPEMANFKCCWGGDGAQEFGQTWVWRLLWSPCAVARLPSQKAVPGPGSEPEGELRLPAPSAHLIPSVFVGLMNLMSGSNVSFYCLFPGHVGGQPSSNMFIDYVFSLLHIVVLYP